MSPANLCSSQLLEYSVHQAHSDVLYILIQLRTKEPEAPGTDFSWLGLACKAKDVNGNSTSVRFAVRVFQVRRSVAVSSGARSHRSYSS